MSEMLNTLKTGFLQTPLGFCPQSVFVFHMIITRSSDYVCKQHYLMGLPSGRAVSTVRCVLSFYVLFKLPSYFRCRLSL